MCTRGHMYLWAHSGIHKDCLGEATLIDSTASEPTEKTENYQFLPRYKLISTFVMILLYLRHVRDGESIVNRRSSRIITTSIGQTIYIVTPKHAVSKT